MCKVECLIGSDICPCNSTENMEQTIKEGAVKTIGKSTLSLIVFCLFAIQNPVFGADVPKPEQLVAEHVKSVGNPALLSEIKSLMFSGTADVNFILGMSGNMRGDATVVSQGSQIAIIMKFGDINYPGEYFAFDGKDITIGNFQPGLKSPIAEFLFRYNKMMKQGIVGGVLSNAWPLLNIQDHKKVKMKTRKTKVEKIELYELEYQPADWFGDMKIRMYFEPDSFRHVRTEYKVRTGITGSTGNMLGTEDLYYTLVEKFEDFKNAGEFTLPHRYALHYAVDGAGQAGFIADWILTAQKIDLNVPDIDPKIFEAEN